MTVAVLAIGLVACQSSSNGDRGTPAANTLDTAVGNTESSAAAVAIAEAPTAESFIETFDTGAGLERFETGIYHRDEFVMAATEWTGDHDLECGAPDTQRVIHRSDASESFYECKDHLMTSIGDTAGYSTGWFTPKQTFSMVRRVAWDVNVTNLGARQWWEVAVISASFDSNVPSCPACAVEGWLSPSPSGLPAYPADSIVVGSGPFGNTFHVHAAGEDFNPSGWQHICGDEWALAGEACASKTIRLPFILTEIDDGRMELVAFGQSYTFDGAFPDGPVAVIFKDHNYTPDKDGPPVGHTWHWDNISIT